MFFCHSSFKQYIYSTDTHLLLHMTLLLVIKSYLDAFRDMSHEVVARIVKNFFCSFSKQCLCSVQVFSGEFFSKRQFIQLEIFCNKSAKKEVICRFFAEIYRKSTELCSRFLFFRIIKFLQISLQKTADIMSLDFQIRNDSFFEICRSAHSKDILAIRNWWNAW